MSVEDVKINSRGLRGALPIQLHEPAPNFDDDVKNLLKFHGIYQQHNRDVRGRNNRSYMFMVRSKLPGGRQTAEQYLVHDALADQFSQGDFRLTTRQGIQFHGVIKSDLQPTLRAMNAALLTTLGACGDVQRNVMCCPAPFGDPVREYLQDLAQEITRHFFPRSGAYHEIWLEDENGEKTRQKFDEEQPEVVEPIYGKAYLPRKFKTAIAYPGDNCIDVLSNDIGIVALIADDGVTVHGFNLYVGGSMGATHNDPATYPMLAVPLGYVPREQILDVVEKIVFVQRDYGDRTDRKHARMKYVVKEWGIDAFRAKVEEYLGYAIAPFREDMPPLEFEDHLGWHQQVDGNWFIGVYVENGRVRDVADRRIRSGLRALIQRFRPGVTITAQQNILLDGFTTEQKAEVEAILANYGIPTVEELSLVRRNSMACPALPTCGLALSEAERFLPSVIDQVEVIAAKLGLDDNVFSIRMTGCPNGCARPYVADIGLVGRTLNKYNIYLGGNLEGTRMNKVYRELVAGGDLAQEIEAVLKSYLAQRLPGERLGDWADRVGVENINARQEQELVQAA
ncbi:MAG: NADPH-dependent assimilatory sulfite reductase hemoprotein subunit [Caldilineaceae bacterium]|nr:NADPH-dependent assimilatory sulfite reductase hemoprotein subunit [Caldilineaceae bacterium]